MSELIVRSIRDLDIATAGTTVFISSKIDSNIVRRLNELNVRQVVTTRRLFEKNRHLFSAIKSTVRTVTRREKKHYERLSVNATIFEDVLPFEGQVVVRPISSLLYAREPQDIAIVEVVTPDNFEVSKGRYHQTIKYRVTKPIYDLILRRARIVVLTCPDFPGKKLRVFAPEIHDSIQLQLNVRNQKSYLDVMQQLKNVGKHEFCLPFNELALKELLDSAKGNRLSGLAPHSLSI